MTIMSVTTCHKDLWLMSNSLFLHTLTIFFTIIHPCSWCFPPFPSFEVKWVQVCFCSIIVIKCCKYMCNFKFIYIYAYILSSAHCTGKSKPKSQLLTTSNSKRVTIPGDVRGVSHDLWESISEINLFKLLIYFYPFHKHFWPGLVHSDLITTSWYILHILRYLTTKTQISLRSSGSCVFHHIQSDNARLHAGTHVEQWDSDKDMGGGRRNSEESMKTLPNKQGT